MQSDLQSGALLGILPWKLNMCREIRQPSAVARKEIASGGLEEDVDSSYTQAPSPDYIIGPSGGPVSVQSQLHP